MDRILNLMIKDRRFEVNNSIKNILVIGMTGAGKSSFVNYITGKNICKVSNKASSCTHEYQMVDMIYGNKSLSFIDTPGLDDPKLDSKNIKELIKYRNTVPRINTVIYCQKLDDNRFCGAALILFNLMKTLYGEIVFKHLIIVRTKSDKEHRDFKSNKNASTDFIDEIKKEFSIDEKIKIPKYYIDSKYGDDISFDKKDDILQVLEKMDPIFMEVIKNIEEVTIYDSCKNQYIIKEKITTIYKDIDGTSSDQKTETNTIVYNLDGIEDVKVEKEIKNSKGCCCCKIWDIIYKIYHKNKEGMWIFHNSITCQQSDKNEDQSKQILEIHKI